ncbi:MAG TPA: hypothetical protein VEP66_20855 [Myxococcales bacterium]|nr:hypothetical protein [Myxococcales bacterium]
MTWSSDAQKSKSGTGDRKAGDPVQPCGEHVSVEAVLDFDEPVALESKVQSDEPPALESQILADPETPPLEPSLRVEPPDGEHEGKD